VNQFVQFDVQIVPTSGSFTIDFFANESVKNGISEFISQGLSAGPGFYLGHDSKVIRASDAWINTGVAFPRDGNSHNYALVVDASAKKSTLYVDGVAARQAHVVIVTTSGGSPTALGKQFSPYGEFFGGRMCQLAIYNGALSEAEIVKVRNPRFNS
jgi:hypothetical protein